MFREYEVKKLDPFNDNIAKLLRENNREKLEKLVSAIKDGKFLDDISKENLEKLEKNHPEFFL